MMRVCVVCEGQTEETFVREILAPHFYHLNLQLDAQLIETSPGHKGGALRYDRVKRHLRNVLRQQSAPIVTTLFDLYKLDKEFPNYQISLSQGSLSKRLKVLKDGLHKSIVAESGCRPERFIPYIQPYEFEALLFSDISALVRIESNWDKAGQALTAVREAAASPEHINDRPETKPAAHLERELTNPKYRKKLHGSIAAQRIGLAKIEAECRFFAGWLEKIRALANS